ncbi:ferredoxin--NADP reductase [Fulvivirgaceae bacterium BMA12]|uniref:Ferredoxin--NADP reductase n=1 Tax=Agaribacillus aureus TaxID=3051825 RepID=A0ABT8LEA6_9BACT|nr:ferredoxin--NADP reductase [Fulvivirgaceae bacterium BMA12]
MAFGFFKKNREKRKNTSGQQNAKSVNSHYYNLKVKEIVQETQDAISLVFEMPEPKMQYKSGQFLTLICEIENKEVRRSYSFSSAPEVDEDIAVTIKRVKGGLMSNYLPDHVKVGDTVRVMEPMGVFTTEFDPNNKRHIIMFAGGSGITPMMSLIKSTLTREPESVVSLIYANRNIDTVIFKEELDKWQTKYEGRLHVIHILDEAPMNWQGHSGLLNHEMLTRLFERIPDWGEDKTSYLMCGPEGMMINVETLLAQQNIAREKIIKESFVAGTVNKDDKSGEGDSATLKARTVKIRYQGEEHVISVQPGKTILETALDDGIDLPYSCQAGLCTACRGKCLSGKVKLDEEEGLSSDEREDGYILTCVGHPLTDDVVIEIG